MCADITVAGDFMRANEEPWTCAYCALGRVQKLPGICPNCLAVLTHAIGPRTTLEKLETLAKANGKKVRLYIGADR